MAWAALAAVLAAASLSAPPAEASNPERETLPPEAAPGDTPPAGASEPERDSATLGTSWFGPNPPAGTSEIERYPLTLEPAWLGGSPPASGVPAAKTISAVLRGSSRGLDWTAGLAGSPDSWGHRGVRAARLVLTDIPLAMVTIWVQHEGFGHAARCRDLGRGPCTWSVAVPPPYGFDLGKSHADWAVGSRDEELVLYAGGYVAEELLTDENVRRAIDSGRWAHLASLTTVLAEAGQLRRVAMGGDLASYINLVGWRSSGLDGGFIRGLVVARAVLDPLLWYSLYDYFGAWLVRGRPASALPDLIPGPGTGVIRPLVVFAPWGPDVGAIATARYGPRRYDGGLVVGRAPSTFTATLWADAPLPSPWSRLEPRVAVAAWVQEELARPSGPRPGAAVELDLSVQVLSSLAIEALAGVKTTGLWQGRTLGQGAYFQAGLVLAH